MEAKQDLRPATRVLAFFFASPNSLTAMDAAPDDGPIGTDAAS
jgi:hypothetical protein